MKGESPACCSATPRPTVGRRIAGLGVALGIAALVVPKCPVCVAGWFAVIGLGAGATGLAAWLGAWGEAAGWAVLVASGMWLCARGLGRARRTASV